MSFTIEFVSVYLLVFVRLAVCFALNPIFQRSSIPTMFRMGLILLLTILVVPMVDASQLGDIGSIELVGLMVKEGLIGAVLGFIVSLFIYMLIVKYTFM